MGIYDILDEFNFDLPAIELDSKWKLFGAPKDIVSVIEVQSQALEKQKELMLKNMEEEQIEF